MVGVMNEGWPFSAVEAVICITVFLGLIMVMVFYAAKSWKENKS